MYILGEKLLPGSTLIATGGHRRASLASGPRVTWQTTQSIILRLIVRVSLGSADRVATPIRADPIGHHDGFVIVKFRIV